MCIADLIAAAIMLLFAILLLLPHVDNMSFNMSANNMKPTPPLLVVTQPPPPLAPTR